MEGTSSQSAAILQSPHPSRLVCTFPACPVGWLTLSSKEWPRTLVSAKFIDNDIFFKTCFFYTQEHPLEEFHPVEKSSHYSPSDKLELFVSVCWKKGKRRCGRNMKKPWLPNWQVGTTVERTCWQVLSLSLWSTIFIVGFISLAEFQLFVPTIP